MYKSVPRELGIIAFKAFVVVASVVLLIVSVGLLYDFEDGISDGTCNVAVFPVEGVILPYIGIFDAPLITTPSTVEDFMQRAEQDASVQAVLIDMR